MKIKLPFIDEEFEAYEFSSEPKNWPKAKGIYTIYCSNTGKNIPGQTRNKNGFRERWKRHRSDLLNSNHQNKYLQNSFDKHGENEFYFVILEYRNNKFDSREKYWIRKLKSLDRQFGWSVKTGGINGKMPSLKGRKFSEEEKRSHSLARQKKKYIFCDVNGENIIEPENLRDFCIKNNLEKCRMQGVAMGHSYSYNGWYNPETLIKGQSTWFLREIKDPDGNIHKITCLKNFCKENKLKFGSIRKVLSGVMRHSEGWCLPNSDFDYEKESHKLCYCGGPVHKFFDVIAFEKKNGLPRCSLYPILYKECKSVHGWHLPENSPPKKRDHILVSPNGEVFNFKSILAFSKEMNISYNGIINLINKKIDSFNGWTFQIDKK